MSAPGTVTRQLERHGQRKFCCVPGATASWRCRGPETTGFLPRGVSAPPRDRSADAHTAPDDRALARERGSIAAAYSMRSSAPRGSDSARWMPSASSRVRVAARRHAISVTASGTRTLGSTSLVRPKSRRIGEALTPRLSTHAMRCGSTQPCTDGAMTARPCLLPAPSGRPAGVVRPFERARPSIVLISRPQFHRV